MPITKTSEITRCESNHSSTYSIIGTFATGIRVLGISILIGLNVRSKLSVTRTAWMPGILGKLWAYIHRHFRVVKFIKNCKEIIRRRVLARSLRERLSSFMIFGRDPGPDPSWSCMPCMAHCQAAYGRRCYWLWRGGSRVRIEPVGVGFLPRSQEFFELFSGLLFSQTVFQEF